MDAEAAAALGQAPPAADAVASLPDDLWARVVPHLRRALMDLPDGATTARTRQLASLPPRKLVAGRARQDVARLLAEGGALWIDLRRRLLRDADLARAVAAALQSPALDEARSADRPAAAPATDDGAGRVEAELRRARDRARELQQQRDDARRRADGAEARAEAAAQARDRAEAERDAARAEITELTRRVEAATADRDAAVAREQRRSASQVAKLEEELTRLRRDLDEAQRAAQRARRQPAPAPAPPPSRPAPRRKPAARTKLVAGRPSRLPAGVKPGTTAAADALLDRGRRVLVDGYNVTRTHRPDLDLEHQRRWLVDLLAAATAARGIVPTVVFDGAGPRMTSRKDRGVMVVFTPEGTSADDDIVFEVSALDEREPITVVTDDAELRDRLRPFRPDLLRTEHLLWVIG